MGNSRSKLELSADAYKQPSQNLRQSNVTTPWLDTDFLLEPPDEGSIKRSWILLSNLIDSHVETFYNPNQPLDLSRELIIENLQACHIIQTPREAEELVELLQIPRYRKLGLRVCIARAVLSSIDFYGLPKYTSLDSHVVELLGRFKQLRPNPSPQEEAALSHWRMITAFFLAPGSEDVREARPSCVHNLTRFLSKLRLSPDLYDTEADVWNWTGSLNVIAQQGINVGEKLFRHPSTWFFEWHVDIINGHPLTDCCENSKQHNNERETSNRDLSPIVLFPALVEPYFANGSRKERLLNVVKAADTGPGLVFKQGGIVPLSTVALLHRSSSPATSAPTHAKTTITTTTDTTKHRVKYDTTPRRRRRRDPSSIPLSEAEPPSPPSPIGHTRRPSTVSRFSGPRSATGQRYKADRTSA